MRPKASPAGNPREAQGVALEAAPNLTPAIPIPPRPAHLGARGAALWTELWEAGGSAYHPPTDRFIIERYCSLHDRRHELLSIVEKDGMISVGSQGQDVLHPAVRALDITEKELKSLEDRLGLNPEARARLGIATIEHKSKLDAFLEGEGL